jgi:hypothetical protein
MIVYFVGIIADGTAGNNPSRCSAVRTNSATVANGIKHSLEGGWTLSRPPDLR